MMLSYYDMLCGMIKMTESLDRVRCPMYPGKYNDIVINIKRRLFKKPIERKDLREILREQGLKAKTAEEVLYDLEADPEVEYVNGIFSMKETEKEDPAGIRDVRTGRILYDRIESIVKEIGNGLDIEISGLNLNNGSLQEEAKA